MYSPVKTAVSAALIMAALDFAWLGFVVNRFYLEQLAGLGRIENGRFAPAYGSALLVYALMALALTAFALPRIGATAPWYEAAGWGALLGACIYGVYDFTNHATLKGWPPAFMAADIAWGATQFAVTTLALRLLSLA
jgi:uncharacterized membrane protein